MTDIFRYALREGRTPGEGSPSFRLRRKFTLSCAFLRMGISLTAVSDQGFPPWTLVAFEKAPQNFHEPCGACVLITYAS